MDLSLIVSLDALADSFLRAMSAQSEGPWLLAKHSDCRFLWIESGEWIQGGDCELRESLDALGEIVLTRLQRRPVERVEISFVLFGNDSRAIEAFLPVHRHFETFLRVVTTRRLYVIYPRRSRLLPEFSDNLTAIQEDSASARCELAEMSFLLEPESSESPPRWPLDQVRACVMCNCMAECRVQLNQVLAGIPRRTCNSSYGACVYDREAWKAFYVLRCAQDLTARDPVEQRTALAIRANKFIETNRLVHDEAGVRYSQRDIGAFVAAESLAGAAASPPSVHAYYDDSEKRQTANGIRIKSSEAVRLAELGRSYRQELVGLLDQDAGSLDSFEEALCFHRTLERLLDDPALHREFFLTLVKPCLSEIADSLFAFADAAGDMPAVYQNPVGAELNEKLDLLRQAFGDIAWTETSLCARSAVLRVLGYVKTAAEIAAAGGETPQNAETAKILKRPFEQVLRGHLVDDPAVDDIRSAAADLDEGVERFRQDRLDRERELRQVRSEYGFFRRIFRFGAYRSRVKPILENLRLLEEGYRHWRAVASAFSSVIGRFLFLRCHADLVVQLFAQRKARLAASGGFLAAFAEALDARHDRVLRELALVPEEPPLENEVELSFLGKEEMERLYQKFGPAGARDYIRRLLEEGDAGWGQWAVGRLMEYLEGMSDYCNLCFDKTPPLDLPKLMFEHFPAERADRVNRLVDLVASRLMPLTSEDLHARSFHMLFGFPQLYLEQFAADEAAYRIERQRISLNPTHVDYVDNANAASLDLTISLCGFHVKDYLYMDVFSRG
ncbi:MAG: hypothetical protein HUU20_18165 [Pirellulales bacterium]|nr:hypothetical protein [Pirellulales bacterium]